MSSSATEATVEVTMPDTGQGGAAQLVAWIKQPGEAIEAEEPICLVRLGDLQAEVVSPATGIIAAVMAEAGQVVPAGASLAQIGVAESSVVSRQSVVEQEPEAKAEAEPERVLEPLADVASEIGALDIQVPALELRWSEPEAEPELEPEPEPPPVLDPLANLASEIDVLEIAVPALELRWSEPGPSPRRPTLPQPEPPAPVARRYFRSPAVRRIAAELGVELDEIEGTGRHGRVTREDVLAAKK